MDTTATTETKPRQFLALTLTLQFSLLFATFFNIPVARQIIGFLYLTFIPGLVALKLLKLDKLGIIEKVLFSVGLSIGLLMLIGLAINEVGPLVGIQQPLEFTPLILVISGFVLLGAVVHYLKTTENQHSNAINTKALLTSFLLIIPIILSVIGAFWASITGNSLILLLMILVVAIVFALSVLSKRLVPPRYYAPIILSIALALLFQSLLISNYIIHLGSDVPVEYFVFKTTENSAYWSSTNSFFGDLGYSRIHSMLSVTILPTIYSSLLNIDSTWLFKIIFPLIFAFVPLCLYQIWQKQIGMKYAFIAAFLFMAQQTFYGETMGLNRQIVAELFFALLLLVILSKTMKPFGKTVLFIIFSFGLVTSHYGLAEIFLFLISFAFISLLIVKRPSRNITAAMIVTFFTLMFSWYIFTTGSAVFDSILGFGGYVNRQLGDFFNPAARGQTVLRGLGLESPPTIWNAISRAFAYATQLMIVVGFIGLVTKRVKIDLEKVYFAFSFLAMALLAALILVPGLANTMNMTRFYHILLFFLAPLCVIGADFLVKMVIKRKQKLVISVLLLIVLIPYFLFQTNFMYEVTGSDSFSVPLSGYRIDPLRLYGQFGYIDSLSLAGAQWLSGQVNTRNSSLYADSPATAGVLVIYGMIYAGYVNRLSNITIVENGGTVYLSRLNVEYNTVMLGLGFRWNSSDLSYLKDMSQIYSNGGAAILRENR